MKVWNLLCIFGWFQCIHKRKEKKTNRTWHSQYNFRSKKIDERKVCGDLIFILQKNMQIKTKQFSFHLFEFL